MDSKQDLELLNESDISLEYYRKNMERITEDFNNQFIAIKGKNVIDHGKTMDELIKKLSTKEEDSSNLFIVFVSKNIIIL